MRGHGQATGWRTCGACVVQGHADRHGEERRSAREDRRWGVFRRRDSCSTHQSVSHGLPARDGGDGLVPAFSSLLVLELVHGADAGAFGSWHGLAAVGASG